MAPVMHCPLCNKDQQTWQEDVSPMPTPEQPSTKLVMRVTYCAACGTQIKNEPRTEEIK